jgi:hypothetical protein
MLLKALLLIASVTVKTPSLKIIMGMALLSLLFWKIVAAAGNGILPVIRKILLLFFAAFLFLPYFKYTALLKHYLILEFDLNHHFMQIFNEFKGSDWADGVLSATFVFIYLAFLFYLLKLNAALDKPPEENPFKIEARIGNVKDNKKG